MGEAVKVGVEVAIGVAVLVAVGNGVLVEVLVGVLVNTDLGTAARPTVAVGIGVAVLVVENEAAWFCSGVRATASVVGAVSGDSPATLNGVATRGTADACTVVGGWIKAPVAIGLAVSRPQVTAAAWP